MICLRNGFTITLGIAFIIVENNHKGKPAKINSMDELTYKTAFLIGLFQLIAAIFPGTSRSGATIVGALILGVSRTVAAEFTFVLAIPVMFGASFLKIVKFFIHLFLLLSLFNSRWDILRNMISKYLDITESCLVFL